MNRRMLVRVATALAVGGAAAITVAPQAAWAATAPPWYFQSVSQTVTVAANADASAAEGCPSAWLPVSGGIYSGGADYLRQFEYDDLANGLYHFGVQNRTAKSEQLTFTVQCVPGDALGVIAVVVGTFARSFQTGLAGGWVTCPHGSQAFGGGEYFVQAGSSHIDYSAPTDDGHGWYATGTSSVSPNTLHVEAYCVLSSTLSGEQHVSYEWSSPPGGYATVDCPAGTRFLVGGEYAALHGAAVDPYTNVGRMGDSKARLFQGVTWQLLGYAPRDPPAGDIDVWLTAWCVPASTPTALITSGPAPVTDQTSATFGLAATDPVGYPLTGTCTLDFADSAPCDLPSFALSHLAEGPHDLLFVVTNPDGRSSYAEYQWIVDTTAPVVTINSAPVGATRATSASFTFGVADANPPTGWSPTCRLDQAAPTPCATATSTSYAGPLEDGPHTFTVTATDAAGNTGSKTYDWAVDTRAPTVTVASHVQPFGLADSATLAWSGADNSGGTGIAHYQVRERRAEWDSGFSPWAIPSAWGALPNATARVTARLRAGYDTCLEVRAVDRAGNAGAWTPQRCTAKPLDDRSLTLATPGWTRAKGAAYYAGTYTVTARYQAALRRTGVVADRVALLAAHCPGCGTVAVFAGARLIGSVHLASAKARYEVLTVLPVFGLRTTAVTLEVTTHRARVQVDGLAISRT